DRNVTGVQTCALPIFEHFGHGGELSVGGQLSEEFTYLGVGAGGVEADDLVQGSVNSQASLFVFAHTRQNLGGSYLGGGLVAYVGGGVAGQGLVDPLQGLVRVPGLQQHGAALASQFAFVDPVQPTGVILTRTLTKGLVGPVQSVPGPNFIPCSGVAAGLSDPQQTLQPRTGQTLDAMCRGGGHQRGLLTLVVAVGVHGQV